MSFFCPVSIVTSLKRGMVKLVQLRKKAVTFKTGSRGNPAPEKKKKKKKANHIEPDPTTHIVVPGFEKRKDATETVPPPVVQQARTFFLEFREDVELVTVEPNVCVRPRGTETAS